MKNVQETVELDLGSLQKVKTLAKEEKRTLQNEAACLLEKGISIAENMETQGAKKKTKNEKVAV